MSSSNTANAPGPSNSTPLLLCEALGFSPQLLLDDIINIANNAVQDGVNGMEDFLATWADARAVADGKKDLDEATIYEVEQGLVAFQTLLEHHTDLALDFFEAWCLRNIFAIPLNLPIVLPHQAGLNLNVTSAQEQEAVEEVEALRRRLDGQRRLNRLLKRSIRTSSRQLSAAEARLAALARLSPALPTLSSIPASYLTMYHTLCSLPPPEGPPESRTILPPGKRQWETGAAGYEGWALGRLLVRADRGDGVVERMETSAVDVGGTQALRAALEAVGEVKDGLNAVGRGDEGDESRMEVEE